MDLSINTRISLFFAILAAVVITVLHYCGFENAVPDGLLRIGAVGFFGGFGYWSFSHEDAGSEIEAALFMSAAVWVFAAGVWLIAGVWAALMMAVLALSISCGAALGVKKESGTRVSIAQLALAATPFGIGRVLWWIR